MNMPGTLAVEATEIHEGSDARIEELRFPTSAKPSVIPHPSDRAMRVPSSGRLREVLSGIRVVKTGAPAPRTGARIAHNESRNQRDDQQGDDVRHLDHGV